MVIPKVDMPLYKDNVFKFLIKLTTSLARHIYLAVLPWLYNDLTTWKEKY